MNKQESAVKALYHAFAMIDSADEAAAFLADIATPAELEALADRWLAFRCLKQGDQSYRTIAAQTGISVTTVGRVARCMGYGQGGYQLIYEKVNKELSNGE